MGSYYRLEDGVIVFLLDTLTKGEDVVRVRVGLDVMRGWRLSLQDVPCSATVH